MPNPQNLKRWGKEIPKPSSEQARINGRKGRYARMVKEREIKSSCEIIQNFLKKEIKGSDGNAYNYKEAGLLKLVQKFVNGDPKATELVLKMLGEMPANKTEVTGANGSPINPPVINILPVTTKDE